MDTEADAPIETTGVESAALTSIVRARDLFFESADTSRTALADVIDRCRTDHAKSLDRARSELTAQHELPWRAVSDYVASVHEKTIEPLREALESLDLPSVVRAWDDACSSTEKDLTQLSRKERLEISADIPFIEGLAKSVAVLEVGVTAWSRGVLDAANAMDCLENAVDGESIQEQSGDESSEDAEPPSVSDRLLAAGSDLEERLKTSREGLLALRTEVEESLVQAASKNLKRLEKALSTASTEEPSTEQSDQRAVEWMAWFGHVEARLAFSAARWTLFRAGVDMQNSLIRSVEADALEVWSAAERAASGMLTSNREGAEKLFEELQNTGDIRQAIRGLIGLLEGSTQVLDKEFSTRLDIMQTMGSIDVSARRVLDELKVKVEELPETLEVHSADATNGKDIKATAAARVVELRATANGSLDQFLVPNVSAWGGPIEACLRSIAEKADSLPPVLRFHLGGAIEELRDASGSRASKELRENAQTAARELTLAGLDRAIEVLAKVRNDLSDAVRGASIVISDTRKSFWTSVNTQFQAESAHAKLVLQLETTTDSAYRALRDRLVATTKEFLSYLSRQSLRLYTKAKELARHGHAAIVGATDPVNYETTIYALADLDNIRSRLPPVYRRLFSFHPLADESLMVGRNADIAWLRAHFSARGRGRTNAVIVTGTPGCGRTTFINAASRTFLRRTQFYVVDLADRLHEECVLADKLADALGLGESAGSEGTLVGVADAIMAGDDPDQPRVCVIERFEHLFLRKIGGFDLAARMLRLMSETAPRVFWIATASDVGWQLLAKNEPLAMGLVSHYGVSGYDRGTLEEVINQRHGRSALPITFDPPADISPLLKRRLRKAQTDEERQSIFRSEFFDALFAASGQNIMLALFYWLLSVRYHSEDPRIQVRSLPQLNFELLADLSAQQHFALKAFLEHATLTLDEYSEISSVHENVGFEIFESLNNLMIIVRARDEDAGIMDLNFERIERGVRYRVRPLLVQPIIRSLRAKNIVHLP